MFPRITYEEVAQAASTLVSRHESLNVRSVRSVLGRGSFATIARHLATWRENSPRPAALTPEISETLRRILAQEIARQVRQSLAAASEETEKMARSLGEALAENVRLASQRERRRDEEERREQQLIRLGEQLDAERRKTEELGRRLREKEREIARPEGGLEVARAPKGSPGSSASQRTGRFMTIGEAGDAIDLDPKDEAKTEKKSRSKM